MKLRNIADMLNNLGKYENDCGDYATYVKIALVFIQMSADLGNIEIPLDPVEVAYYLHITGKKLPTGIHAKDIITFYRRTI